MHHPEMQIRTVLRGSVGIFLALITLFLSACGKAPVVLEPAEITFLHTEADAKFYGEAVEAFRKKAPNITVNLDGTDMEGNWEAKIEQADCFAMPAANMIYFMPPGQNSNGVSAISLDEMIAQDDSFRLSDFYPGPLQLVSRGGKTYGIPAGINPVVMYYNKALFDAAGVAYPQNGWTWDDFLNTALAIRSEPEGIWGYAPVAGMMDPVLFIYQGGGGIVDDLQNPTRLTLNDPQTIKALDWFSDLFHVHKVAPTSPGELGSGNTYQGAVSIALLGGKIGLWMGSYQEMGGMLSWSGSAWPFQWGMVSLPRGEKAATYMDVETYAISSKTKHIQACWQWIAFLSRQINREARLIPARKSLVESSEYQDLIGAEVAATARASLESALPPPDLQNLQRFSQALQRFGEAIDGIIQGKWTPQDAMDTVQEQAK